MDRRVCLAILSLMIVWTPGCKKDAKTNPTVTVKGMVKFNGKPLPEGEATLVVPGAAPAVLPIKDGVFSGNATVGKNRVEIRSFVVGKPSPNALSTDPPNPKVNIIPDRFSGHSTLEANVTAAGPNDFTFDVASP